MDFRAIPNKIKYIGEIFEKKTPEIYLAFSFVPMIDCSMFYTECNISAV